MHTRLCLRCGEIVASERDEGELCECQGACPGGGETAGHDCTSDGERFWKLSTMPRRCRVCGGEMRYGSVHQLKCTVCSCIGYRTIEYKEA